MRKRRRRFKTIGANPLENLPEGTFGRRNRRSGSELESVMKSEMREYLEAAPPGFLRRFLRRLLRLLRGG